jgi:HAD superfamily hydrolase (TIGR01459 family)
VPAPSVSATASQPPRILAHAGAMLERYDVLFCDVWGVVHDGLVAFDSACAALETFRQLGGTVILVSNAPVPKHRVVEMLDARKVPRTSYDDVVSSGDLALTHIADRQFKSLFCIGPLDRDAALFTALTAPSVALDHAEAIVCSGLNDDHNEAPDDYLGLLHRARAREIPFVCANPDLIVDVGGTLLYCAGAIADLYQAIGGDVFWAGKPYLNAYETAHHRAEALRNRNVARNRVLVIGDAVRTDIKGAENFGCDALFVASGIHRHETMDGNELSAAKLAQLFTGGAPQAAAAMTQLRW